MTDHDTNASSSIESFILTPNFQVDFTAYAPLHTFKGWTNKGVEARMDIDFDNLTIVQAKAIAQVSCFDTGDKERNQAMMDYIRSEEIPEASLEMTQVEEFSAIDESRYKVSIRAILTFMGIKRNLPLSFTITRTDGGIQVDLFFKWSFKAYGLKAPQLLLLKVRDIVDIKGTGFLEFAV